MSNLKIQSTDLLTVSELRRTPDDPSLWVLNTSDLNGTRKHGDILIEISMQNGKAYVFTVPKTWIPIDLSNFARRDLILESTSFLQATQRMTLTPVKSEWAEAMHKRQDVLDERNLLALKSGGREFNPTAPNKSLGATAPGININARLQPMAPNDILDAVSPRVISVMEQDDASMSPAVKLLSLKGLTSEIKGRDLRYILSKCGVEHQIISKWANDMAQTLRAAGGEV